MPRIVHLGVGNFHRAHQAALTAAANRATGERWRVTGVSLRRSAMRDALAPQNYRYVLVVRDQDGARHDTIDVIDDILVAPEAPEAVIAALAEPETRVVTLTVTEKAYRRAADGGLDHTDPDIAAELAGGAPTSVPAFLARGLAARAASGAPPLTILSCDNLSDNGATLERLIRDFATASDAPWAERLGALATFPNAMVDRIAPATTDDLRREVASATGFADAWPVETEAFVDWVIERRFAGPVPAWDRVGARFVEDAAPYELRKLRLLNGAHSHLAYVGLARGFAHVHEAVADPALAAALRALMEEAAEDLPERVRADAASYAEALMARFANPALRHRLDQIAIDGSKKLPVRTLPTIAARRARGAGAPLADATVAAWVAFVRDRAMRDLPIEDPASDAIRAIVATGGDVDRRLRALLFR